MNIKRALMCLSIVAILMVSMPNVAAAKANKQTTDVLSCYAIDVQGKNQSALVLALSNNTTVVNTPVDIYGALATKDQGTIYYIGGATITLQQLGTNGTAWNTLGTLKTFTSGKAVGFFAGSITPKSSGYYILRATYDGDNNYESAVSNVVALTVN